MIVTYHNKCFFTNYYIGPMQYFHTPTHRHTYTHKYTHTHADTQITALITDTHIRAQQTDKCKRTGTHFYLETAMQMVQKLWRFCLQVVPAHLEIV